MEVQTNETSLQMHPSTIIELFNPALSGCATHTVKTTSYTPIIQDSQNINEDFLLDVGVAIFDPGIDELDDDQEQLTNHQVRLAESRYAPYLLSETLQRSANWGIVRLMPNANSPMDVFINGVILESNGETMSMRVSVSDSTGRQWYQKGTNKLSVNLVTTLRSANKNDPFQILYNNIANDLLEWRQKISVSPKLPKSGQFQKCSLRSDFLRRFLIAIWLKIETEFIK